MSSERMRADLAAQLDAHRPADDKEAEHRALMLDVLATQPRCFERSCMEPGHFTASGFLLDPSHSRVALVYHRFLQRWLQPGGHLNPDDPSLAAAARRELIEETGASLASGERLFDVDVHALPPNPAKGEGAHLHLDVRFLFYAEDDALGAGDEGVAAVRWFPIDEVASIDTDESVMRPIRRLLTMARANGSA